MNKNLTEKYATFDNLEEIILKREYKESFLKMQQAFSELLPFTMLKIK